MNEEHSIESFLTLPPFAVHQQKSVMVELILLTKSLSRSITFFPILQKVSYKESVYWEANLEFYNWNQQKATQAQICGLLNVFLCMDKTFYSID